MTETPGNDHIHGTRDGAEAWPLSGIRNVRRRGRCRRGRVGWRGPLSAVTGAGKTASQRSGRGGLDSPPTSGLPIRPTDIGTTLGVGSRRRQRQSAVAGPFFRGAKRGPRRAFCARWGEKRAARAVSPAPATPPRKPRNRGRGVAVERHRNRLKAPEAPPRNTITSS